MPAAATLLTAADLIHLSKSPTATLPSSLSSSTLLSLLSSLPPTIPLPSFLSAILTLISQSPPSPPLSSLLSSLLLSQLANLTPQILLLFSPLLPSLPKPLLPPILDSLTSDLPRIQSLDDSHRLDLLPFLLNQENAPPIVDRFLAVDWSKSLLLKILTLLRESTDFCKVRVSETIQKVFNGMQSVEIQDLPSIVYQLLVLASKGVMRREIVKGVLGFEVKGKGSVVRQVEGTILMHVNFAVKQDPVLGSEVVGVVKGDYGVVNHFAVAVVLSIARVRRFGESAVGVLKGVVVGSLKDYKMSRDCKWLPDKLKEECLDTAKHVEKAFVKAINESAVGREHVVPSIVQFCFVLLESVDGDEDKSDGDDNSIELMGFEKLGIQLLKTLFEVHDMARNEIIEQCKFRILSLKPQQSTPIIKLLDYLVQSYPYLMVEYVSRVKELLDYFTFMHDKTSIDLIRAILPLIKFSRDLQDYIVLVLRKAMFRREDSVRIAAATAIIDLIIVENKSKKTDLNSLQDSSSQASCSQQPEVPFSIGGSLFQELSGLLIRCLSQQARVKQIVYQGLLKLVVWDPFVAGPVFDLLRPHFLKFYTEEAGSLLRLDACFKTESGKACLLEPLDCLLSCISWILLLQPHGKSDRPSQSSWPCFGFSISQENEAGRASSGESFSHALSKIRKNLTSYRIEDGSAQSQDFGSHSLQGDRTYLRGWILLGVIEVFVNVVASELEKATTKNKDALEKEIVELVDSYGLIEKESDLNRQGSGRKGASRTTTQDIPAKTETESRECPRASLLKLSQTRSFFATSSIHQLLVTAVNLYTAAKCSETASQIHSQTSKKLNSSLKLISFSLKVCYRHLKSISATGSRPSGDCVNVLIYGDVNQLGRPIMQLVLILKSGLKLEKGQKKEIKGKKFLETKADQSLQLLLCLNELFKLNSSRASMTELVEDMNSVCTSECDLEERTNDAEGIYDEQHFSQQDTYTKSMHLFLEKKLKPLYSRYITLLRFQESEVISELIITIGKTLPCEQRISYGTWAVGICKRKQIENPGASRSLLALAIYLLPVPDDLIFAQGLASELLIVFGSEDKDPMKTSEMFPVINHSTKNVIATMLMQLVETCIPDLDWAVMKLKVASTSNHFFTSLKENIEFGEKSHGLLLEEAIYSRSEALVNVLSSFTEMNLKDSQAEQLLRLTAKFYKLLARMTKFCIAPKGFKQHLPGQMFQKLAEVTCKKLTGPLYNFMALLQRNQQDNSQHKGIISKIKRENKCIPDLIYQIEDYERYLIQLSKVTKVNLLRHAKRSTARDFKILETKKMVTPENEPSQANSASSGDDESGEASEGMAEENGTEKALSPESAGGGEGSESDTNEEEMVVAKKRAKMSKVVQDSDEEE